MLSNHYLQEIPGLRPRLHSNEKSSSALNVFVSLSEVFSSESKVSSRIWGLSSSVSSKPRDSAVLLVLLFATGCSKYLGSRYLASEHDWIVKDRLVLLTLLDFVLDFLSIDLGFYNIQKSILYSWYSVSKTIKQLQSTWLWKLKIYTVFMYWYKITGYNSYYSIYNRH